ncbi:MAG TPA: hypothetical protein PLC76_13575 [Saprospiraceae bacterium]|jgi:hypothetical protein|nr:hypothetical protein [Saprospiraceae bacterium]HRP85745.1 hypothetical protein [Saprospiraceae bacterium]
MKLLIKIFIAIIFFSQLSCKNCDPVKVYYNEEEPYEEEVSDEIELTYSLISQGVQLHREAGAILFGTNPKLTASIVIQNTSSESGTFSFTYNASDGQNSILFFGQREIPANATLEISDTKEIPPNSFNPPNTNQGSLPEIIAPKKKITKKVTKYRTVQKERMCNPCQEQCN